MMVPEDMSTLILISANSEWRAVRNLLAPQVVEDSPLGEWFSTPLGVFFHGGWGKIAAAASTQYGIDHFQPQRIINLGTCGGFAGRIQRGAIILVTRTLAYDILEQMGDPAAAIAQFTTELDLSWLPAVPPHPVTRTLLVSGDRDLLPGDIRMLEEKYGAVAADWESAAIAWVAKRSGIRCLILRGVTDLVSAEAGEAYGNIELFHENTQAVMERLVGQLPDWLRCA